MSKWLSVIRNKKKKKISCEYDRWMVEAQLRDIYDTSDTIIVRHFYIFTKFFKVPLDDAHPLLVYLVLYTEYYYSHINVCERLKFAEDLLQLFLLSVLCWEIVKNVYIYGISAIYRHCVPGTWWCWVAGYLSGTDLLWVIGYVLICHIHRPTSHMVVAMTPINNEMFLVGGVVVWSGQSTHQPVPTHTPIHTHLPIQIWAEAKKRYTLSVRGQKQVHT